MLELFLFFLVSYVLNILLEDATNQTLVDFQFLSGAGLCFLRTRSIYILFLVDEIRRYAGV